MIRGEYGTKHTIFFVYRKKSGVKNLAEMCWQSMGNLGVSLRRFYEVFIEQLEGTNSELDAFINSLPPVEPQESADPAYKEKNSVII